MKTYILFENIFCNDLQECIGEPEVKAVTVNEQRAIDWGKTDGQSHANEQFSYQRWYEEYTLQDIQDAH